MCGSRTHAEECMRVWEQETVITQVRLSIVYDVIKV